jgi:branched-chain amino acid aminotransferase
MVGIAYIDDAYMPAEEARLPLFDLGFLRGDAVYDTTSVWRGQFFRLDDHIARFRRSMAGMRLTCPHDDAALARILATCVERAGLDDAFVQMIVTRGRFPDPTRRDLRTAVHRFIAFALPYIWIVRPEKQEIGIDVAIVENRRTPTEAIDPTVKNFNWMDLQRGMLQGLDRDADNVVLCTPAGHLSEGPGFNLFFVKGGRIHTPAGNVLEGITRRTVMELARESGLAVETGNYGPDALRGADEAFLSSTAGGIMPVTRVDGRPLGNGAPGVVTSDLRGLYWRKREAGWLGTPVSSLLAAPAA